MSKHRIHQVDKMLKKAGLSDDTNNLGAEKSIFDEARETMQKYRINALENSIEQKIQHTINRLLGS